VLASKTPRYTLSVLTVASGLIGFAGSGAAAELTYWSMWNETEPGAQALRTIMDAYSKANPATTFKVVWNGRQNQTKLRSALQAGIPVDFMDQDSDQLAGGLQKEGLGYDITNKLDADSKAAFLPGTLDIYAADGKYYQIPYIYNTVNFWYNRDMLKEAGVEPPKTWTELIAMCAAVRAIDKYALVVEGNVADYNLLYFSHLVERSLGSGAVAKLFEDKTGAGWADPAVLAAAKRERELWDAECIASDARGFQWPAGQQTVALGDSMGEFVGSWLPIELASTAGEDFPWGAFNFPAVEGGAGKVTDLEVWLLSMMVLKDAPHPEEAAAFLKYVMSEEAQKVLAEQGGLGVTRKGIAWPAVLADAEKAASEASMLSQAGGGLNVFYPDFTTRVLAPEHNKMFLGEITPEQFVEILVAETKKYWESK